MGMPSIDTGAHTATDRFKSQTVTALSAISQGETALDVDLSSAPLPNVFVNNANLSDIKAAVDASVKKTLAKQQFNQSHQHTDVKLALGWTAAIIALGTTAWSYRLEFEDTRFALTGAVAAYMLLSSMQFLYGYYIEGRTIFVGKRKSLSKRIETERVQVLSSTSLFGPAASQRTTTESSPHSRPSSPSSPIHGQQPGLDVFPTLMRRQSILPQPTSELSPFGPTYSLTLLYTHTTNSGKSLIRKAKIIEGRGVGEFFDANGGLEESLIEGWVIGLVSALVGSNGEKDE